MCITYLGRWHQDESCEDGKPAESVRCFDQCSAGKLGTSFLFWQDNKPVILHTLFRNRLRNMISSSSCWPALKFSRSAGSSGGCASQQNLFHVDPSSKTTNLKGSATNVLILDTTTHLQVYWSPCKCFSVTYNISHVYVKVHNIYVLFVCMYSDSIYNV